VTFLRRNKALVADLVAAGIGLHLLAMALCPMPNAHGNTVETPFGWFEICAPGSSTGESGGPADPAKGAMDCPACDAICQFSMFIVVALTLGLFVAASVTFLRLAAARRVGISFSPASFRSRAPPFLV